MTSLHQAIADNLILDPETGEWGADDVDGMSIEGIRWLERTGFSLLCPSLNQKEPK